MSLQANIEHLQASPGIITVAVVSPSGPRELRGDESWSAVLEGAMHLLDKTDEPTIRLVIGKHTVVLQTEKDEIVGVVLPTGHAIAKSLRRMIRRMSRKVRPPLVRTPATHQAPVSPAPVAQTSATTPPSGAAASPVPSEQAGRTDPLRRWG